MLGALAEVGKAAFEAQAAKKAPAIPQQPVMIMPQMMPGMNPGMMQGGMPMQMGTPLPGMPGVPSFNVPPPQGARPAITDNQIFEDGEEGGAAGQEAERVEAGNEESEEAPEQEEQRPASQAERLMEAAADAGLPMQTQRKARKALRALVRKISTTKEEDWFGVIASAIQNEIGIYHYVKAVTVKAALVEAGADDELSGRVVESMRKSGMIPDDVPYEEGDQA
jgi:hypothetical protein